MSYLCETEVSKRIFFKSAKGSVRTTNETRNKIAPVSVLRVFSKALKGAVRTYIELGTQSRRTPFARVPQKTCQPGHFCGAARIATLQIASVIAALHCKALLLAPSAVSSSLGRAVVARSGGIFGRPYVGTLAPAPTLKDPRF